MGNILIGIKRFLQNKNTVTLLAILASLGILYWAYSFRIQKATEPVSVPYATRVIAPRTEITSEMIGTRKVPGGVVSRNVITNSNDIVGKYVLNTAVIPQNSLFYSDMIGSWEDLPSSLFADIPDDNYVIELKVDMDKTYGNSIYNGNYIDLYYKETINENNQRKVMVGKFIESIKVLAVTDSYSTNVFETADNPKQPNSLMFSVDRSTWNLLKKAQAHCESCIFPVPRNAAYSSNPKETRVVSAYIQKLIESYAVADSIVIGEPTNSINSTTNNTQNSNTTNNTTNNSSNTTTNNETNNTTNSDNNSTNNTATDNAETNNQNENTETSGGEN